MAGIAKPQFVVCTGRNVLVAGDTIPGPATIKVDLSTGKIIEISRGHQTKEGITPDGDEITWIDAGDMTVLPGLVEFVFRVLTSPCKC